MAIEVSINNLNSWLASQQVNTPNTAYEIIITDLSISDFSEPIDNPIRNALRANSSKYVDLTNTILPSGITSLSYAFSYCETLIMPPVIPNGVEYLNNTFADCTNLKNVFSLPDSIEGMTAAFSGCTSLRYVENIPANVTDLSYTFMNCQSITSIPEIPEGVTTLLYMCSGCSLLTNVPEIPATVTNISWAYENCTSLVNAPMIPDTVTTMTEAFKNCILDYKPVAYNITGSGAYSGVTTQKWKATEEQLVWWIPQQNAYFEILNVDTNKTIFGVTIQDFPYYFSGLDEVCVCVMGISNVSHVSALKAGLIGNINTLYDLKYTTLPATDLRNAFENCTNLTYSPAISSGTTRMDYMFSGCTNLYGAPNIPNTVLSIEGAFMDSGLYTPPALPNSVTNISKAFYNSHITTAPEIPSSVTDMESAFKNTAITSMPTIPTGITNIDNSFEGCTLLVNVTVLPDSVTSMQGTFSGCSSLVNAPFLPDNVQSLDEAFKNCSLIDYKPVIPSSAVSYTDCYAGVTTNNWKGTTTQSEDFLSDFYGQTNDCELQVYNTDKITYIESIYNIDKENLSTWLELQTVNTATSPYKIHIRNLTAWTCHDISNDLRANPTKFVDLSYTELPNITSMNNFFCAQHNLSMACVSLVKAPEIPSTVTDLDYAFAGCINLKEAPNVPNSVTTMDSAFRRCLSLVNPPIIGTGVIQMQYAFCECRSLTSAPNIPNGCENINGAFSITSISVVPVLPNSLYYVSGAFSSCQNITSTGPLSHLTSVSSFTTMFNNCSNLVDVSPFPIRAGTFYFEGVFSGTNIRELPAIPEGTISMRDICANCTNLTTVHSIPSTVTNATNAFKGCTSLTTIKSFKISLPDLRSRSGYKDMFKNCPSLRTIGYKPQEASAWHVFSLKFDGSSVQGKVYGISNGQPTSVSITQTSITQSTLQLPVLTDELYYPDSQMSDADLETLILNMLETKYGVFKRIGIPPNQKNFVLWADEDEHQQTHVVSNFLSGGGGGTDIAVYPTLADAEADLANLNVGDFIATEQGGDGITDAVTDGDARAVTSNAVYDFSKWVDISSQVTVAEVSSGGSYTISKKKFYMSGNEIKCTLSVVFNYAGSGGSNPLKLRITSPLFTTEEELSRIYSTSYYGTYIWTIGMNVYSGETNVITFRPNYSFASGHDATFTAIIPIIRT